MIYFNKCDVFINGTGILASSATLSTENAYSPLYALGARGPVSTAFAGPLRTTIQLNYLIETHNEPVYYIVSGLKNNYSQLNYDTFKIGIGGVTGYCFLESYSVKVSPNEPARASASFVSFVPTTGALVGRSPSVGSSSSSTSTSAKKYNSRQTSGNAHAWTTELLFQNSAASTKFLDFDYSFKANWEPRFIIGQKFPTQVQFLNGSETFNFTREVYSGISFTGMRAVSYLNDFDTVRLNSLSLLNTTQNNDILDFCISGSIVKSVEISASVGDMVQINSSCEKSH